VESTPRGRTQERRRLAWDLVEALYGGKDTVHIEAQVKYEDGRTGMISADLAIRDAKVFAPAAARRAA